MVEHHLDMVGVGGSKPPVPTTSKRKIMPEITLPDNSTKVFPSSVTVLEVAESIGPGLAKSAIAAQLDGQMVDVSHVIEDDASLAIITSRDAAGLDVIRHSCAHLMAQAVKSLYHHMTRAVHRLNHGFSIMSIKNKHIIIKLFFMARLFP